MNTERHYRLGWRSVPLADLAAPELNSITDGPFGSKLKTGHYTEAGPRVVRLQNIGDGVFCDERAHISEEHFATLQKHRVFAGDLLIGALGETLPRACIAPETLGPAIVKADCIRFKPHPGLVLNKYLLYALISPQVRHAAATIIHGVGRPRLNQYEIKSLPIPLAPRDDQEGIVAEIEKQFTRLDAGVAALKRLRAHLRRNRAAVIQAAFEGKLVPSEADLARAEGRAAESAHRFLEATRASRTTAEMGTHRISPDADTTRDELPQGWCWATLGQLAWDSGYGTSEKCDYGAPGNPVLRIPNISRGAIDTSDLKHSRKPLGLTGEDALRPGDLLIVRTNGSKDLIGRGAVLTSLMNRPTYFASYLIRFRLVTIGPLPAYIALVWHSPWVRRWIESHASNSAGQYNINMNALSALPIPIPPPAEAMRIVRQAEETLSVLTALESTVTANLARGDRLRAAILRAAFEGRLTTPEQPIRAPAA